MKKLLLLLLLLPVTVNALTEEDERIVRRYYRCVYLQENGRIIPMASCQCLAAGKKPLRDAIEASKGFCKRNKRYCRRWRARNK